MAKTWAQLLAKYGVDTPNRYDPARTERKMTDRDERWLVCGYLDSRNRSCRTGEDNWSGDPVIATQYMARNSYHPGGTVPEPSVLDPIINISEHQPFGYENQPTLRCDTHVKRELSKAKRNGYEPPLYAPYDAESSMLKWRKARDARNLAIEANREVRQVRSLKASKLQRIAGAIAILVDEDIAGGIVPKAMQDQLRQGLVVLSNDPDFNYRG